MSVTTTPGPLPGQYPEHDLAEFPEALKGKRILLCTESFGPVNGVSRTTLMLVNHLRANGVQVAVVAPHNHTQHNHFTPPPSPSLSPSAGPDDGLDEVMALRQPEVRVTGYPLPFNPELAQVSYQVMSRHALVLQVLVVAIPNEVLEEYESVVREAGFEPGVVLPGTLAIAAALDDGGQAAALLVSAFVT